MQSLSLGLSYFFMLFTCISRQSPMNQKSRNSPCAHIFDIVDRRLRTEHYFFLFLVVQQTKMSLRFA